VREERRLAALAMAVTLASGLAASPARAAEHERPALAGGAGSVEVALPPGTPLGGYGAFPRRAWAPDVLDRWPHAFWMRPAAGLRDPIRARALVLAAGEVRLLWLAVDLVGVDPSLLVDLRARLARQGRGYTGLIVSASHTHSGPGAYSGSELLGFVALDRLAPAVRASVLDALEAAAGTAAAAAGPAHVGWGRTEVDGVTRSRLRAPLDPELLVLKVTRPDGAPVAAVWSYAIHGTMLGPRNALLSGDVMAAASLAIERRLGVPALFVNGAVGDVSPAGHGAAAMAQIGDRLAEGARRAWEAAKAQADHRLAVVVRRLRLPPPALRLRNCLGVAVPRALAIPVGDALPRAAEVVAARIGPGAVVTVPGELETRLGREIKAAGAGAFASVMVAGLSNDYVGYLLTREGYARPSYVSCSSVYGARGGELARDAAGRALADLAGAAPARPGG